ncbi:MAG: CvpA family protein [Candidatus Bostrichicola ureolyticus]|nr:MAG: CvpA family protein [Candidatus Bostrichicola ureolyticus]
MIDLIIFIPLIIGGYNGYSKGFLSQLFTLCKAFFSLYMSMLCYITISKHFNVILKHEKFSYILSFIICFITSYITISIFFNIKKTNNNVDKLLGILLGIINNLLLLLIIIYFFDFLNQKYQLFPNKNLNKNYLNLLKLSHLIIDNYFFKLKFLILKIIN